MSKLWRYFEFFDSVTSILMHGIVRTLCSFMRL